MEAIATTTQTATTDNKKYNLTALIYECALKSNIDASSVRNKICRELAMLSPRLSLLENAKKGSSHNISLEQYQKLKAVFKYYGVETEITINNQSL